MLIAYLSLAWRRRIAAALGVLLSMSIVGQQLPCLHGSPDTAVAGAQVAGSAGTHQHVPSHGNMPAQETVPAPHHDPAAPGCAQLMACGLAVQSAVVTIFPEAAALVVDRAPSGPHLQYSMAYFEVEAPPPRG